MPDVILKIDKLTKQFGGVHATDNVCLSIHAHEIHAIIGPNGAGKTTLVSQLSGNLKPDAGEIFFQGLNITNLATHKRAALGLSRSFQITSLIMTMTVLDNVALAAQAHDGHSFKFWKPAREIVHLRQAGLEILKQLAFEKHADTLVSSLSHGERRLVEIAVALATNPKMLLLDEPMAGMGAAESFEMVETLLKLKSQKTILLIEHDMDAVFALADRISVLVYGKIIATGTPGEIRNNTDVRHAYLGEA